MDDHHHLFVVKLQVTGFTSSTKPIKHPPDRSASAERAGGFTIYFHLFDDNIFGNSVYSGVDFQNI